MEPRSDRLRLPLLPRAVLCAGAAPRRAHAFVDYRLHPDGFSHTALMALRAAGLEADPVGEPRDPVDGDEIIHLLDYAAPQA